MHRKHSPTKIIAHVHSRGKQAHVQLNPHINHIGNKRSSSKPQPLPIVPTKVLKLSRNLCNNRLLRESTSIHIHILFKT